MTKSFSNLNQNEPPKCDNASTVGFSAMGSGGRPNTSTSRYDQIGGITGGYEMLFPCSSVQLHSIRQPSNSLLFF